MADPFVGEIRMFGFNYPPVSWAMCDGTLMDIGQQSMLFSVIGTTYGGDETVNFALPDLRGRSALGMGTGPGLTPRNVGNVTGSETVTLTTDTLPAHNHAFNVINANATASAPDGNQMVAKYMNGATAYSLYGSTTATSPMANSMISPAGQGGPHANMQPYTVMMFCICLDGIYPVRP